jgi:hypothetical protein
MGFSEKGIDSQSFTKADQYKVKDIDSLMDALEGTDPRIKREMLKRFEMVSALNLSESAEELYHSFGRGMGGFALEQWDHMVEHTREKIHMCDENGEKNDAYFAYKAILIMTTGSEI